MHTKGSQSIPPVGRVGDKTEQSPAELVNELLRLLTVHQRERKRRLIELRDDHTRPFSERQAAINEVTTYLDALHWTRVMLIAKREQLAGRP